jgi:hypothetical protein
VLTARALQGQPGGAWLFLAIVLGGLILVNQQQQPTQPPRPP